jgi:hypothetical protein
MTNGQQQEHILVVAKDEELRGMMTDTLESAGHYRINQAGNFEEALSEILLNEFDDCTEPNYRFKRHGFAGGGRRATSKARA